MTDKQWNQLLDVVAGGTTVPPLGFIIDCPWLPNWFGRDILDYFTSEDLWFEANRRAIETFPEVLFLPGFWSEFGMCTEPSAFGAKCVFHRNAFPFADKVIRDPAQIEDLAEPDPATDGLLPFMLNRLRSAQPRIEELGHRIRFSVSRGPLNIASFLMGTTEFLMLLKTDPARTHKLLGVITRFLKQWHQLQRQTFPTIDGIFNTLDELRRMSGNQLSLLGNLPPRDVLAKGSPEEVRAAVTRLLDDTTDHSRLILSCAGGMPPGVSTENLRAFIQAAEAWRRDR